MGNKTLSDSDIDSDDVWDDLEDDLDILDEEFEEDIDQDIAHKKKKNVKKAKNSPKEKVAKPSSSKLLFATVGFAALSGGGWFAVTSNPDLLNLVMGMTTGGKYFEQTKVDLDKGQSSHHSPLDQEVKSSETVQNNVNSLQQAAIPPLDDAPSQPIPDLNQSVTQKDFIENANKNSQSEDHGFLTPLPTESSQIESSENQSIALSDLDDHSNGSPIALGAQIPKQEGLNEPLHLEDMTADGITLETEEKKPDVKLEENVLLDQTEKSYEEIPSKDLVAPPMPELMIEEKDTLDILTADTLSNELNKDSMDPIKEVPSVETALPTPAKPKDAISDAKPDNTSSPVANIENSIPSNLAKEVTEDKKSQNLKKEADIENKLSKAPQIVSGISAPIKSSEKPKLEDKKLSVSAEKKELKKNKAERQAPIRKWSLRSANSNSAVLLDKSSGNIVSIGIGSQVDGLGKIKIIAKENGKWIVKGTKGSIVQ